MTMLEIVDRAIGAMPWLTPADGAAVELARAYARALDAMTDADAARLIGQVGPGLLRTLAAIGGTPAARAEQGVDTAPRGKLAELRGARAARVVKP